MSIETLKYLNTFEKVINCLRKNEKKTVRDLKKTIKKFLI